MGTFERLVAVIERMSDRLEVMGDQIRANTQAILRALARLDGPPGERLETGPVDRPTRPHHACRPAHGVQTMV
jgi:hypothetical protein